MEESKNNADFLSEIHRGVRMGMDALDALMERAKGENMHSELVREKEEFRSIEERTHNAMRKRGIDPAPNSTMKEIMATWGVQLNTAIDRTPSHIADILMQGNQMGVIGITKTKNKHPNADAEILCLADDLVSLQEHNIEALKVFL